MNNLKAFKEKSLQNKEVQKAYEELEEEFSLINSLLAMRNESGLTQDEIAKKMGTKKSNISRLERGNGNPSWNTLLKYAHACGFNLKVTFDYMRYK